MAATVRCVSVEQTERKFRQKQLEKPRILPLQPSQLLSLPPEVLVNVVANLPYSDLYRLALTAHCFYELSLGPLYASTTIQIGGVYWEREVSKLGNLIRNDTLRMRLRHLTVISIHGLLGYEVAVAELISLILTARPSPKLLSFTWKVRKMSKKTADILSYLEPGLRRLDVSAWTIEPFSVVHGLEELSYRRLTNDGVMWFSQQLRCVASTLKRLSVHVFSASHKDASKSLLRGLKYLKYNSCQLSHLRLSGVCLQGWDLGFIYSITSLCLLNCSEIDYYLSGWMDNYSYESRLEHLELVIPNGTSLLPQFLGHASAAQLKTLKVLLKSMTSFPLNVIQGNKLTTLVIEARRDIYDPKTVHPYTIDELVLVLNSFTNLVALGVPVHLELSEITQGLKLWRTKGTIRKLDIRCHRGCRPRGLLRDVLAFGPKILDEFAGRPLDLTIGNERRRFSVSIVNGLRVEEVNTGIDKCLLL